MKIYRANFNLPSCNCVGEYIVCEDEEAITKIIAKRKNTPEEKIDKLESLEVSKERVYIRDLTVGDFLRLSKIVDKE